MITVRIWRGSDGRITRFRLSGHAGFDEPGRDVVCAGVSAVAETAVRALQELAGLDPAVDIERRGAQGSVLDCNLEGLAGAGDDRAQTILEAMVVGLKGISEIHPEYIHIEWA